MGFKGPPDPAGHLELGYGFSPACRGRGYAAEMVRALTVWALVRPDVCTVTAQTAVNNAASRRVLEKAGFVPVGECPDSEDGPLRVWACPGCD
ncbi:RimJ/RimL family protein N-acetyltransferase [Deinobacterium chartae]|uniref:RimJ/RimL family protein N-acetyltransferase n=1 Tax=Deinobacterium chartae TaxID=521158 RepID=A0A841I1D4_9DEIO|nr:GNAT family N-acetyltransferase [Deinobacterium chartae]MBB6099497.1 RimJ/RimL family protein N-acetyltransferase [Deinobacterium chartae]